MLDKVNRINLLYDFYHDLLTEKQQEFLTLYYSDNLSLREIADEYNISRQAVFEHIKRAEQALDDFENKLKLLNKFLVRQNILNDINDYLKQNDDINKSKCEYFLGKLYELDEEGV